MASSNRLATEWRLLTEAALPIWVVSTIQAARRASMNRIYQATWSAFSSWCHRSKIDPLSASINHILIFLQDGFEAGLAPNTLRRQLAALASVLSCGSTDPITRHLLIRTFLRGATNL